MNRKLFSGFWIVLGALVSGLVLAGEGAETKKETATEVDPEIQQARQLLDQFEKEKEVRDKYNKYLAASFFKTGRAYYEEGKFMDAKKQLGEALRLDPQNAEARQLLDDVEKLLGLRQASVLEDQVNQQKVARDFARMELDRYFEEGQKLFEARKYDDAIRKLQTVNAMAQGLSATMDVKEYINKADYYISEARKALDEEARRLDEARRVEAMNAAEQKKKTEKALWEETLQRQYREAVGYYERGKYAKAEELAEELRKQVVQVEPKHPMAVIAEGLRVAAKKAGRKEEIALAKKELDEQAANWHQYSREMSVPQSEAVRFPPAERWSEIVEMGKLAESGTEGEADPAKEELKQKLQKIIPSINFNGTPLNDAVAFLHELTDANIILDATLAGDTSKTVSLNLSNVTLEDALKWVCKLSELKYALKGNAIYIGTQQSILEDMVLKRYDVSDILAPINSFSANTQGFGTGGSTSGMSNVGGGGGGGLGGGGGGFDEGDEDKKQPTGEELIKFIMSMVKPPGGWEEVESSE